MLDHPDIDDSEGEQEGEAGGYAASGPESVDGVLVSLLVPWTSTANEMSLLLLERLETERLETEVVESNA